MPFDGHYNYTKDWIFKCIHLDFLLSTSFDSSNYATAPLLLTVCFCSPAFYFFSSFPKMINWFALGTYDFSSPLFLPPFIPYCGIASINSITLPPPPMPLIWYDSTGAPNQRHRTNWWLYNSIPVSHTFHYVHLNFATDKPSDWTA